MAVTSLVSAHFFVALLWLLMLVSFGVYDPAPEIVRWFDETRHVFLANTVAALSLAGVLYLANLELFRLTYLYFYLITLGLLLGYRYGLRIYYRLRQNRSASSARFLVVGAGKVGQDIVNQFKAEGWPGVEFVGFLDDAKNKQGHSYVGLPVLGTHPSG